MPEDKYANMMYSTATESAANTLTFEQIDVGVSMFDKVGFLIHRIEWFQWWAQLLANNDAIEFGLSASNSWSTSDSSEASIITFRKAKAVPFGTAGNMEIVHDPIVDDFSMLPGGGHLITPKPLYIYVVGSGLAAAGVVKARIFFTIVKMKPDEYFELLESRTFFET